MSKKETIFPVICDSCRQPYPGGCNCGKNDYVLSREFSPSGETSENILRDTAEIIEKIEKELILLTDRDDVEMKLLVLRAEILSQLTNIIRVSSDFDSIDKDLFGRISYIKIKAEEALENKVEFLLRMVLKQREARIGDPNMLEQIIDDFFN